VRADIDADARDNGAFKKLYAHVRRQEDYFKKLDGKRVTVDPVVIRPPSPSSVDDDDADWWGEESSDEEQEDDEIDVEALPAGEIGKVGCGCARCKKEEEEEGDRVKGICDESKSHYRYL
jgi:hypothetical protein